LVLTEWKVAKDPKTAQERFDETARCENGDPGSGRSRLFYILAKGRNPRVMSQHSVADGINAVRLTLRLARFDAVKCAKRA
jgi:hypothetical protein